MVQVQYNATEPDAGACFPPAFRVGEDMRQLGATSTGAPESNFPGLVRHPHMDRSCTDVSSQKATANWPDERWVCRLCDRTRVCNRARIHMHLGMASADLIW